MNNRENPSVNQSSVHNLASSSTNHNQNQSQSQNQNQYKSLKTSNNHPGLSFSVHIFGSNTAFLSFQSDHTKQERDKTVNLDER